MGGGSLLDAVLAPQPTPVDQGNSILGQIFGSKDVSRSVAAHGEAQSGVSADILKKMLPLVAMAVAGYLARQGGAGGADGAAAGASSGGLGDLVGGMIGNMLGGAAPAPAASAPAARGGQGGGLGSLLDMDGDGNALDDILGMAGKLVGR